MCKKQTAVSHSSAESQIILRAGHLLTKSRKRPQPFQRERRVRQRDLQTDRDGNSLSLVHALRLPDVRGQHARGNNTARETSSAKVKTASTPRSALSTPAQEGTVEGSLTLKEKAKTRHVHPHRKTRSQGKLRAVSHRSGKGSESLCVISERISPPGRLASTIGNHTICGDETGQGHKKKILLRRVENSQSPRTEKTRSSFNEVNRTQLSGPSCAYVRSTLKTFLDWTYWCLACPGTQLFCRQECLMGCTAKRVETIDTSADTIPSDHAGRNSFGKTLCAQESAKESCTWFLFEYTNSRAKPLLSKWTASILRHAGHCHERDGACS